MAMMTMAASEDQTESDNRSDEPGDPGDQDASDGHKHDVLRPPSCGEPKIQMFNLLQSSLSFFGRFKKR